MFAKYFLASLIIGRIKRDRQKERRHERGRQPAEGFGERNKGKGVLGGRVQWCSQRLSVERNQYCIAGEKIEAAEVLI